LAASSNPGTPLLSQTNLAVLRNDIGKARQEMAAYLTAPDKTVGAGFGTHAADHAARTDPRGFNWDQYSETEQKEIEKSVGPAGSPGHDALARAIGMGRKFWPSRGSVSPVPHGALSPLTPPTNAVASARPANALAA
jgi:hypothetical protein